MAKRYALELKTGQGFATYIQFFGEVTPNVPKSKNSIGGLEDAILFTENQLQAIRKTGRTTKELIEEHLTDFRIVPIQVRILETQN